MEVIMEKDRMSIVLPKDLKQSAKSLGYGNLSQFARSALEQAVENKKVKLPSKKASGMNASVQFMMTKVGKDFFGISTIEEFWFGVHPNSKTGTPCFLLNLTMHGKPNCVPKIMFMGIVIDTNVSGHFQDVVLYGNDLTSFLVNIAKYTPDELLNLTKDECLTERDFAKEVDRRVRGAVIVHPIKTVTTKAKFKIKTPDTSIFLFKDTIRT